METYVSFNEGELHVASGHGGEDVHRRVQDLVHAHHVALSISHEVLARHGHVLL